MSEEQLKAFLEKLKSDISLHKQLKAAADSDAVLAIAKEAGFSISADHLKHAQSRGEIVLELSEEELEEGVAAQFENRFGGRHDRMRWTRFPK